MFIHEMHIMKPAHYSKIVVLALICGAALALHSCKKKDPYERYGINRLDGAHAWHGQYVAVKDTSYTLRDTTFKISVLGNNVISIWGTSMTIDDALTNDSTIIFTPPLTYCDCSNRIVFYYNSNIIKWIRNSFGGNFDITTTYITP